MSESSSSGGAPAASERDRERSSVQASGTFPGEAERLEELVAEVLEAPAEERAARLARLDQQDVRLAHRVRAQLAALGELGMALDGPARAADVPIHFGPFRRHERVGGGGMGEVYFARDERDGGLAAVKLVRPDHLWFETARARFRREIEASTELAHEGIVRVLEVGEERGVPWLALEWVGGVSLEEVLERLRGSPPEALGPRDFERAVRAAALERPQPEAARETAFPGASHVEVVTRVVARVARALAHAHARGVLHRDVKPSNILVTPAGRVLLADFGLALPRGADRMTRTGQWLGSLPYAAPEQIEGGPRRLDPRADLYSLGATLYELVTLRTPFLGGPESVVRRRIATGDLEGARRLNPALPRELERILRALLDPEARRRPSDAGAVAGLLEAALAGAAVHVRGAPLWLRARRWTRRRPRLALALTAASLVVLGSLAVALREKAVAARLTRLGDAELVRGLSAEARAFWPAAPRHAADMRAWLARAEELLARGAGHRRALGELTRNSLAYEAADRVRDQSVAREDLATLARELDGLEALVAGGDRTAPPAPPAPETVRAREALLASWLAQPPEELLARLRTRVAEMRARMRQDEAHWRFDIQQLDDFERVLARAAQGLGERATFRFADPLDAWRHHALRRLLEELELLAELVPRVRAQLASTAALAARFEGEGAARWARACAAVRASRLYAGLELAPIFGLLPLAEDPRSGLWEFLLLSSGNAPRRDEHGNWRVEADTGAVLVLLPGGRFRMGQRPDEGPPLPSAQPVHEVELAPFFLSRFELTAAQAERLGGFPPEKTPPADGRLPLVLDWERAREVLLRHGLELPTEAQWEYAARAGGAERAALEGQANVFDRARARTLSDEQVRGAGAAADFDDGFAGPAPVGSFRPNAFGLHDVLGNVSEWCLDAYVVRGYSTLSPRAGDGLRATIVSAQVRVVRGGSCGDGPGVCQPAVRANDVPTKMPYETGVRPVRSLAPD